MDDMSTKGKSALYLIMLYHVVTRNAVRQSGSTVPRRQCDGGTNQH